MELRRHFGTVAQRWLKNGARLGMPVLLVGGLVGPVVLTRGTGADANRPVLAAAQPRVDVAATPS